MTEIRQDIFFFVREIYIIFCTALEPIYILTLFDGVISRAIVMAHARVRPYVRPFSETADCQIWGKAPHPSHIHAFFSDFQTFKILKDLRLFCFSLIVKIGPSGRKKFKSLPLPHFASESQTSLKCLSQYSSQNQFRRFEI